jgi:hypothetical protein
MDRLHSVFIGMLLLVACVLTGTAIDVAPAHAQACSSDAQCGPSAGGYNVCLGDTLIMRRRICVAGQCLEQETGRMSCGGGRLGGTCQGNVYVGGGGNRCDALSGRCVQGSAVRQTCTKSCSCVGRTLVISTGACSPGIGCIRTTMRCKVGCTCSGEARCTEEPTKAPQRGVRADGTLAKPAPKVNKLPPRMAEPFDPNQPRAAVVVPPAPVVKSTRTKKKKRSRRLR